MAKQLRYMEIVHGLKERIRQGSYPPGKALPSQKELAEVFSATIMTVRQALAVLEEEGLIRIVHGVGTFPSSPGVHADYLGLPGFQREMGQQKQAIQNRIVGVLSDREDPRIARIFGDAEISFSCLVRLRCLGETPVILQKSWLGSAHRKVLETYSREMSLYQYFSRSTGEIITQGRELVTPILLGEEAAEVLGLDASDPALFSRRISFSLSGKVVLYDEAWLPGSRVIMASSKQGKNNQFRYIIRKESPGDFPAPPEELLDSSFWEGLE